MAQEPNTQPEVTNKDIERQLGALARTIQTLSDVLSTHVRSNLETLKEIREYIGSQIAYRSYREGIEENKLKLDIDQKNLEIRYKEKLLQEEATENDALKLEQDKLKLELASLKENLEVLKVVKSTTQERLKVMPPPQPADNLPSQAKKAIIMTSVAFLTTSVLGGILAVIIFVIRLYILSNP
jgi:hypothetical protein